MADFISHHLFGCQALAVFPSPVQMIAAEYPTCFNWGCQGPDPMFYRKAHLGGPLHKLGNRMHSENTSELFYALTKGVQTLTGSAHKIAAAYFFGLLCHYALDSEIHPYVYCRQEQFRSVDPRLSRSAVHSQIEGDIDYLMYERVRAEPVTNFTPEEYYTLEPEEKAVIAVLLHAVLLSVYDEDIHTHELRCAFDDMLNWENFLFSENRLIYKTAQKFERVVRHGPIVTGHMKTERPAWDALNDERNPWHNPWTPREIRHQTITELFGLARIRAAALAGQYTAQLDSGWLLKYNFDIPFDNGNPKALEN